MTNPIVPAAAGAFTEKGADEEADLPVNNDDLDEGESNDDQGTVERDIREAAKSNERLDK
jgi:hypothetical protein